MLFNLHEIFPEDTNWNGNELPGDFYPNWKVYIWTVSFTAFPIVIALAMLLVTEFKKSNITTFIFLSTVMFFSGIKLYDSFRRVNEFLELNEYNTRVLLPLGVIFITLFISRYLNYTAETKLQRLTNHINDLTDNELHELITGTVRMQQILGSTDEYDHEVVNYAANQEANQIGEGMADLQEKLQTTPEKDGRKGFKKTFKSGRAEGGEPNSKASVRNRAAHSEGN